jgi:hypothetical protein
MYKENTMNGTNWVGVDTHKDSLACYKDGKFKEFKTNKEGLSQRRNGRDLDHYGQLKEHIVLEDHLLQI